MTGVWSSPMGLTTADDYRASLRDGRTLWYRGRRVHDILEEPDLRVAVDHATLDHEIGHARSLATWR
jgi:4-hydroxybutyryl-CoA dehydratase / vinylacetyl-CoA-Delta-isomerase